MHANRKAKSTRFGNRFSSTPLMESLEPRQLMSANTSNLATPVGWQWYQGVSASFLKRTVASQNERIVDLKVQSTSPLTFTAALVQNAGVYKSRSYWYYGQSADQLSQTVGSLDARIVSLDPYMVNGNLEFASLLVPNAGSAAKAWWWYYGQTGDSISSSVQQNDARLIDLEPYDVDGQTYYADVMISNTGADAEGWWWYTGVSPDDISNLLNANDARLVNLAPQSDGSFDLIMNQNDGQEYWWYYGMSASDLQTQATNDGARIFDIDSFNNGGQTVFSAVLIDNSTDLETTVGNTLRASNPDPIAGAYLRQVDGPTLADFNGEQQFEPASAIKIVLAVAALRAVQAGKAHLRDTITYYYDPSDPTNPGVDPDTYAHTRHNAAKIKLGAAIGQMLEVSDNRITEALEDRFSLPAINATASLIGMTGTVWTQTLGSGIPGNFTTASDLALLYNNVLDGSLLDPAMLNEFQTLIINQTNYGNVFASEVQQEAANVLGVDVDDPNAQTLADNFLADMQWGAKGGSYDIWSDAGDEVDRTEGGYLELPFMNPDGSVTELDYTYGIFIDNAEVPIIPAPQDNPGVDQINNALFTARGQLVQGIVDQALETWV